MMKFTNFFKAFGILLAVLVFIGLALSVAAQDVDVTTDIEDEEAVIDLLESSGIQVYPLEDITEIPPTLRNITPTSAQVEFISTIPVGCLLVYGDTPEFGNASQSPDMSSAAITDHYPPMIGLEPETTYYYRMQGTDVNGNFYTSPVYSFTTPAESDEETANLLSPQRGAEVIAFSSNFGDQPIDGRWGANNAFDDDPNTAWSSNGDGNDAFVTVRLGQRSQITELAFWTRTMSNNTAQIFSFMVTTEDGTEYGPFELPDPDQAYTFEVDFEAETLRFDVVDSNGGNTGAVDIAAYGEALE